MDRGGGLEKGSLAGEVGGGRGFLFFFCLSFLPTPALPLPRFQKREG